MSKLYPKVDPEGLLEYSVVFNDRSLNHMSAPFQQVMRDISATLRRAYNADGTAVVPGGGSYGMEAVARQFANDERCLILRNGWFSYRWSQILEVGQIAGATTVLKARAESSDPQAAFAPVPADEVAQRIREEQPAVVFAPHVETAAGLRLPDTYLKTVADAVHEVGGLFVLDCVASGNLWVDMKACGVDVLISAPQKGWSASPCAALIGFSERALVRLQQTTSSSFAIDLKRWYQIMQAYEDGSHSYHATMPTESLVILRNAMEATEKVGFATLHQRQEELGDKVRALFTEHGFKSVAAQGYEAAGVVVFHTTNPRLHDTSAFREQGLQIASGVPLMCDESEQFRTFRLGLFGLDKLNNVDQTVARLRTALQAIVPS
ncbi:aminotransferase class V-fold PLP-dependent enzyme [Marinobacter sp. X15-166B]|uniref:aminotransferase class V-fold PLP-dependent enzyme n=1 Tax=Marinobacter sp. X15-166B TaxID=1897620 RepID=UPI00085C2B29|nr:aminotransferase class V-fold PLP-dependent enzyme [Marinobacter sp. X15-166B]OEY65062.1 class V aminotransferase [Marinobacter sp. X15-166B]